MYQTFRKFLFLALTGFTLMPSTSFAVPSFARQTGMDCAACHTSFPELTPFGREFKLNGYTLGERKWFPVAAMAQFSVNNLSKEHDNSGQKQIVYQNDPQFDVLALFIAGKLSDHVGMFLQWTYSNNSEQRPDTSSRPGSIYHHSGIDNTDIRVVGNHDLFGKNLIFGLDLNNNPTVQDVWNSTPAWGYPFNGINQPVPGPSYSTMIEGGLAQQVAGLGGYFFWDRHLYGELSLYGNANDVFRVLSAGQPWDANGVTRIDGRNNPYWRLSWNQDWGANSLMVGTYGMQMDVYPDSANPHGQTDRFTDTALDAQFQHISDPGIFSVQTTYIHEKQDYKASFDPSCDPSVGDTCQNKHDHLNTFNAKASYLYNRKYGASLAYFTTNGSYDPVVFSGSGGSGKPNSKGYIAELDYNPWTNVRFMAQYRGYTKIDGSTNNVDGNGRSAHDDNTLFIGTWFAF